METKKLFVGNIAWGITWQELKDVFSEYGVVEFARIITDRETGKSKGFGFVEFASAEEAKAAKEALDGKEINGRPIKIDFAIEKEA